MVAFWAPAEAEFVPAAAAEDTPVLDFVSLAEVYYAYAEEAALVAVVVVATGLAAYPVVLVTGAFWVAVDGVVVD